ncbi:hypothetical protein RF11_14605 [Thelohanellus kitauei]|uniref:Uncharacterized protein n=1 Tax=Thelohanellus kitauei TaxID=669202 RepID=A0A0C2M405_THEKT|nr:hypothetical protein RF11_14605 [Thelohanellus kitauei]
MAVQSSDIKERVISEFSTYNLIILYGLQFIVSLTAIIKGCSIREPNISVYVLRTMLGLTMGASAINVLLFLSNKQSYLVKKRSISSSCMAFYLITSLFLFFVGYHAVVDGEFSDIFLVLCMLAGALVFCNFMLFVAFLPQKRYAL